MKKTMRFLSMAALALVGAVMTGCSSSDDSIIDNPQQPENKKNIVTVRTTISLNGDASTRALTSGGVKTFVVGDKIAVYYQRTDMEYTAVAASEALESDDISADGKTATFTVTFENPKGGVVEYCYPYASGGSDIEHEQDGTLETLQRQFDQASGQGTMTIDGSTVTLPTMTLQNQYAILALTLKTVSGTSWSDYTSNFKQVTVSDGTDTYTINGAEEDGTFGTTPIYVAIYPVESSTALELIATDGTDYYTKTVTSRTYKAGTFNNLTLRMAKLIKISMSNAAAILGGDYTEITLEKAYAIAKALKTVKGGDTNIYIVYKIEGSGLSVTAYYASSADATATEHMVTAMNFNSLVGTADAYCLEKP